MKTPTESFIETSGSKVALIVHEGADYFVTGFNGSKVTVGHRVASLYTAIELARAFLGETPVQKGMENK